MKHLFFIFQMLYASIIVAQTPLHPFPNHTNYTPTHIKPTNYTQIQLDNHTSSFYDQWKNYYLKNDCGNSDEYYIYSGNTSKNVSEAQGYGMMITAFMAGYDTNAQLYFDGLYHFYKSHPSNINLNLMDWQQITCNDSPSNDDDSASDGDIDIAFSLLLANRQWGSQGTINYLLEATQIIEAIMASDINHAVWSVKLGDWANSGDSQYYYGTRSSDFIMDHFRAFYCQTQNTNWNQVINTCYNLLTNIQVNYSPNTGLLPDFIIHLNSNSRPAGANYLEGNHDGEYYYNACRTPWRIALDYLLNNELIAKNSINTINTWLRTSTNGNTNQISNGYKLNGEALYNWNDASFIGPFTVAAMCDINHQDWLNNLYNELLSNTIASGDYYSNTIKLLSLISISGNYWVPNCNSAGTTDSQLKKIKISPNIISNHLIIKGLNNDKAIFMTYLITDTSGRIVLKGKLKDKSIITVNFLKNGLYILSIELNSNQVIYKKFLKK